MDGDLLLLDISKMKLKLTRNHEQPYRAEIVAKGK